MKKLTGKEILPSTSDIEQESVKNWADEFTKFILNALKKITSIPFNRSEELTVDDTGDADTTVTLSHHLGRVPRGFMVIKINKADIAYVDATDFADWSTTVIKFKCSTPNVTVSLCLF